MSRPRFTQVVAPRRPSATLSLRFDQWPDPDRQAWRSACVPSRRFSLGGSAAHLAEVTRSDLVNRYGLFLDYLRRTARLRITDVAAELVTSETIAGFVAELKARVRSVTVAGTVYKVRRMAQLLSPQQDFGWLSELERDLALVACPQNKTHRIVTTESLVEAGLTLIAEASMSSSTSAIRRARLCRDGLMIALLAVCPIRLKNLASLEIGGTLLKLDGSWWVALRNTKSRRPDERPLPTFLDSAIEQYLSTHRLVLLNAPEHTYGRRPQKQSDNQASGPLWIGSRGGPLGPSQVARCITHNTRVTLGVEISPHLFRVCAATTAAVLAPDAPFLASGLLHHTDQAVTQEHYNRASSLSVACDYSELIGRLRRTIG
jgi:integrase